MCSGTNARRNVLERRAGRKQATSIQDDAEAPERSEAKAAVGEATASKERDPCAEHSSIARTVEASEAVRARFNIDIIIVRTLLLIIIIDVIVISDLLLGRIRRGVGGVEGRKIGLKNSAKTSQKHLRGATYLMAHHIEDAREYRASLLHLT